MLINRALLTCRLATRPYKVTSSIGPWHLRDAVGIVKSRDEAIPAFLDYYDKHPVPWEVLRVEQDQQGDWLAYRDDYPMLENLCAPARFKTCADAKRAADVHELDLFPNAKVIDDGYSWLLNPELDWRSVPYLTEGRRDVSDLIVWRSDGQATAPSPN
jgi:hypothetical protein